MSSRTFEISKTPNAGVRLPTVDASAVFKDRGMTAIEGTSIIDSPFVQAPSVHGLLAAAHVAFAQHLPLILSPDAIWIAIAQALARHVDANADALRPGLVRHRGQIAIEIRRDEFLRGETNNDWGGAIDEISQALRPHLGGRRDLFVADFSTTTAETRIASEIALLAGMQRFFSYSVGSLCGIPSIVLEGTADDWSGIVKRVEALADLDAGLSDWVRVLRPGEIDLDFWQRIYKPIHASGGEEIVGWLNAFFPFLGDEGTKPNPALASWMDGNLDPEPFESPKLSAFPTGLSMAPFVWDYHGDKIPMTFAAGAFGVQQTADGDGVRPRIGWAVTPRIGRRSFVAHAGHDGRPWLSPIASKSLENLLGLADDTKGIGPFAISLGWCDKLESFEGASTTTLAGLDAIECNRVTTLDSLRGMTGLTSLSCSQMSGLRDISAIATLTGLKRLALSRCPNVTGLEVIGTLRGLEYLTLWHLPGVPEAHFGQWTDAESIAKAQRYFEKMRV